MTSESSNSRKELFFNYLLSLRESNYDYHHHKETTVVTIAGLYIGAVLTVEKPPGVPLLAWSVVWVVIGLFALYMVFYHFHWRFHANATVLACNRLLLKCINGAAFDADDLALDNAKNFPENTRPKILNREVEDCRRPCAGGWKSAAWLQWIIVIVVLASLGFGILKWTMQLTSSSLSVNPQSSKQQQLL
ncbi:MAG: hypothetical protein HY665_06120 [Chloroflexi bacterium]|nr:hypothetical protein [Chloroflexota bacterium]